MADEPPLDQQSISRAIAAAGMGNAPAPPKPDPFNPAAMIRPPAKQDLYADASYRLFGMPTLDKMDPAAYELKQAYMRNRPVSPLAIPYEQANVEPYLPYRPAPYPLDLGRAFRLGFEDSHLGALGGWMGMQRALGFQSDPNYDPYSDRRIKQSKWADQWYLFEHSRSEEQTAWILARMARHDRDSEQLDRMGLPGQAAKMAGGLLGDPLTWIPLSFGAKATLFGSKLVQNTLAPVEVAAFGVKPIVMGAMTDALRAVGAQTAIHVAADALRSSVDPTFQVQNIASELALPSALAASAGFARGAMRRFSEGMDAWRSYNRKLSGLLDPVMQAGTPEEFRAGLMGTTSIQRPPVMQVNGLTGWQPMRELQSFKDFMQGNALVDAAGQPLRVYHGTTSIFDEFSNQELGKATGARSAREGHFFAGNPQTSARYAYGPQGNIRPTYLRMTNPYIVNDLKPEKIAAAGMPDGIYQVDTQGRGWRVENGRWQYYGPQAPVGERLTDKATGKRLVDMTFKPGELERAVPEASADEIEAVAQGRAILYTPEIKAAKAAGHDGVILRNTMDGGPLDSVYVVFDPKTQVKAFSERYEPQRFTSDPALAPGALGTGYPHLRATEAVADGLDPTGRLAEGMFGKKTLTRAEILRRGAMVPTGIGIENLGLNAVDRSAASPFITLQSAIERMFSAGGRQRNKNLLGVASAIPVDVAYANRWKYGLVESTRSTMDAFREYRMAQSAPTSPGTPANYSDFDRLVFNGKTAWGDLWDKQNNLAWEPFRRRVGDALRNGDVDTLKDAASPFVEKAAASIRKHWDDLKGEARNTGVFEEAYSAQLERLNRKVAAMVRDKTVTPAELDAARGSLTAAEQQLNQLRDRGPSVNTAPSYRPRLWLQDKLLENEETFKDIVRNYYATKGVRGDEANDIANSVFDTLARQRPIFDKTSTMKFFEDAADATSAQARTFQIPDEWVKDFLENDVEVLNRWHTQSMGMPIEMMRKFGSTGLENVAADLATEGKELIKNAATAEEKATLRRQLKLGLEDLQASRDRLYGTYGVPEDPHSWDQRLIRMAKQFSNLTLLGMSGITALGDLVRPAMTEGIQAMHQYGFKTLASEARSAILQLSRRELEISGDAAELINNVRALSASDTGDLLHSRTGLERWLHQANQYFFVANGLNAINQLDKEWSGVIIQGRINDVFLDLVNKGKQLSKEDAARFAGVGINQDMAVRIGNELEKNKIDFKSIAMANTTAWTDREAAKAYASALYQMNNRTVPTPGLGDTPNMFSSPLGSLIFQYKSFAAGALTRTLYAGLQEQGARFWYGAAMAVGFGIVLNEIRSRLFYDKSTFDRPLTAVIADGVERSSLLGWFTDVNRAIESLTGHRVGVRPLIGAEQPHRDDAARQAGLVLGPAVGQGVRAVQVAQDFMSGHPVAKTWSDARSLAPGATLPYMDPIYDRLISDGRWHNPRSAKARASAATAVAATE